MNDLLRKAIEQAQAKLAAQEAADSEPTVPTNVHPIRKPTVPEPVPVQTVAHDSYATEQEVEQDAAKPVIKIKGLDEKAVLVDLRRRMYSPNLLDQEATEDYAVGNVNKHLFEGSDNRVKQTIARYTDLYRFVKSHTVPWSKGIDMLNIRLYSEFTAGIRNHVDICDQAVKDLLANWDFEVQKDIQRIQAKCAAKGIPDKSDPANYPSADELAQKFGIEIRYMPVPTTGDFRVGISEEDKASLQKQLDDAEANATKHVLQQMIEPMRHAAEKLSIGIGEDGSIFRDSMIDKLVEVAERMNKINMSDDPIIQERIDDLRSLVGTYARNKEILRNNPTVREKAAKQIDDLVSSMSGLV